MRKLKPDPKYLKVSFYVFMTGAALLLLWKALNGDWSLMKNLGMFLGFLWKAVATVAAGLVIAYILQPAVTGLERLLVKVLKKKQLTKGISALSVALVYVFLAAVLALAGIFVIPMLVQNIIDLGASLPGYYEIVENWYFESVKDSTFINNDYTQNAISKALETVNTNLNEWVLAALSGIAGFIYRFIVSLIKGLVALVISAYFLLVRREIKENFIKTSNAFFGEKKVVGFRAFLRSVDWVFGKYISATLIKALIMFIIVQIAFALLKVPYSTLMSGIIALTNIVPFIGPILGMIPPILLSLLQSPIKALWVFLAIQGAQLVDAYLLQPYLVGDKMGLSPFWVLVSVMVGGSLFGLWGIVLAVPVVAVIKILVNQSVRRIERKKEMDSDIKG